MLVHVCKYYRYMYYMTYNILYTCTVLTYFIYISECIHVRCFHVNEVDSWSLIGCLWTAILYSRFTSVLFAYNDRERIHSLWLCKCFLFFLFKLFSSKTRNINFLTNGYEVMNNTDARWEKDASNTNCNSSNWAMKRSQ